MPTGRLHGNSRGCWRFWDFSSSHSQVFSQYSRCVDSRCVENRCIRSPAHFRFFRVFSFSLQHSSIHSDLSTIEFHQSASTWVISIQANVHLLTHSMLLCSASCWPCCAVCWVLKRRRQRWIRPSSDESRRATRDWFLRDKIRTATSWPSTSPTHFDIPRHVCTLEKYTWNILMTLWIPKIITILFHYLQGSTNQDLTWKLVYF